MLTTPRPATDPANATTPAPAASIADPGEPARSTPRCPASHGCGGGVKVRVTAGVPGVGHRQPAPAGGAPYTARAVGPPAYAAEEAKGAKTGTKAEDATEADATGAKAGATAQPSASSVTSIQATATRAPRRMTMTQLWPGAAPDGGRSEDLWRTGWAVDNRTRTPTTCYVACLCWARLREQSGPEAALGR